MLQFLVFLSFLVTHFSFSFFILLAHADIVLQDPCRPGVRDAVELCKIAGVKVLVIYSLFAQVLTSCLKALPSLFFFIL